MSILGIVPIQKTQIGPSGAALIGFSNIPQSFSDILLIMSIRSNFANPSIYFSFNNDGSTLYSDTFGQGDGSSVISTRLNNSGFIRFDTSGQGSNFTSGIFGSYTVLIPNYSNNQFKSLQYTGVTENNASGSRQTFGAGLYRSTSPITQLVVDTDGDFVENSVVYLYGII